MIRVDRVTKYYKVQRQKRMILDNQSFYFQTGVSYGLLGVNGAGKSTTMRLLSGAEAPNRGHIKRDVRVSWPLGFASGFNPLMSGKENLKFVARAYGEDVDTVLNFVHDFAEIGDYMEEPVGYYSSGMRARFAFGLSMAIEFDCYLVDEITAVGDARFKKRCEEAFADRCKHADLIMVSHSMSTIKKYCDKGVVLIDGNLIHFNDVESAIQAYYRLNR